MKVRAQLCKIGLYFMLYQKRTMITSLKKQATTVDLVAQQVRLAVQDHLDIMFILCDDNHPDNHADLDDVDAALQFQETLELPRQGLLMKLQ